jgi:hypothetical protein
MHITPVCIKLPHHASGRTKFVYLEKHESGRKGERVTLSKKENVSINETLRSVRVIVVAEEKRYYIF